MLSGATVGEFVAILILHVLPRWHHIAAYDFPRVFARSHCFGSNFEWMADRSLRKLVTAILAGVNTMIAFSSAK